MAKTKTAGEINAYLDGQTVLEGEITVKESLRIDGKVKGKVTAGGEVVVGPTAVVDAEIEATTVSVSGKAAGRIKATDRVEIFSGGVVTSSLVTPSLKIADGAVFQGHCEMNPGGKIE